MRTRSVLFILCFICIFCGSFFSPSLCHAQKKSLTEQYPFSSRQVFTAIKVFEEKWYNDQGEKLTMPFIIEDKEELSIYYTFSLDCMPPDTLFLYFEGIGWDVGIELNEHYLGKFSYPFSGFSIPVRVDWLKDDQNILQLHLSAEGSLSFHPDPFIFLLKPPLLLDQSQQEHTKKEFLQTVEEADTVALFAPYYRFGNYSFDLTEAYSVLKHLRDNEIKYLYFLFGPSEELKALCAQLGFIKVETINERTHVCFVNAYPYDAWNIPLQPQFWLDSKGRRTKHYGSYFKLNQHKVNDIAFSGTMVWMVLLPLFALLIVKLLNPGFFYSLPGLFTTPKLFIDNFSDASYSNLGLIFILQFIKILSLGATAALMIFYIQQVHDWQLLTIFQERNLFRMIFDPSDSIGVLFIKVSLMLLIWIVFMFFLNSFIGSIYRIKGMALGVLNLDIVGSYPLVVLLVLPASLLIFSQIQWNTGFVVLLILMSGLYILRKLYVFYIGLGKLFNFSLGVKILYICALNIIPYMILF